MAKTKADLHREWARVLDMCEGTIIYPEECCKFEGVTFDSTPGFSEKPESYEFAVAILEGKPVFVGDRIWSKHILQFMIVDKLTLIYDDCCSWHEPERTFSLNGIELPCPTSNGNWAFMFGDGRVYKFKTQDNRDKVSQAIIKILDEAVK